MNNTTISRRNGDLDVSKKPPLSGNAKDYLSWAQDVVKIRKKQTEIAKRADEDKNKTIAQMRREQAQVRIAEQEEINRRMKEKLERKNTELRQSEIDEEEEMERMRAKMRENVKSTVRLNKLKEEQMEYSAIVGSSLLSKALKVDYKEDPGNCLCPEGKICASSRGVEAECDFWTCPVINPATDQAEITMAALSKTMIR